MPEPILIALITVGGGLIGAWITRLTGKKKVDADVAGVISKAASDAVETLLAPLSARVKTLEGQVADQQCTINRYGQRVIVLMRGIEKLIAQIKRLDHVPVWQPDEWTPDSEEPK